MMDVPFSDYAFLLVDNVVRVFSIGSAVQVRTLCPALTLIHTILIDNVVRVITPR